MTLAFLLGAGFSVDAAAETGILPSKGYPLTDDLLTTCFGLTTLPPGTSIEDLFGRALSEHNLEPVTRLSDLITDADGQIAFRLSAAGRRPDNVYATFLRRFPDAHFLTFNYDSLVEVVLLSLGRWRPDDGYGVRVEVGLPSDRVSLPERSANVVLHLHGSLCVYAEEYRLDPTSIANYQMLAARGTPLFGFDPDALSFCFHPFEANDRAMRYHHLDERIVAPVPDKADGLKEVFITEMYRQADIVLSHAELVVAVGYRFGPYDKASYRRLFRLTRPQRVLVVAPDAIEIVRRLRAEYPSITWEAEPKTFAAWVRADFPGLS
jgi:hypothetical protein